MKLINKWWKRLLIGLLGAGFLSEIVRISLLAKVSLLEFLDLLFK